MDTCLRPTALFTIFLGFAPSILAQTHTGERGARGRLQTEVFSGIGTFQDIQVPFASRPGIRSDGRTNIAENQDHRGLALGGSIAWANPADGWSYEGTLSLMQMRATNGPAETSSSSYSRIDIGQAAPYQTMWNDFEIVAAPRLNLRRSSFLNVSNGHFVDALLIGGTAKLAAPRAWYAQAGIAMAATSRFGFNDSGAFAGQELEATTTAVTEYALRWGRYLGRRSWFQLGIVQEAATVQINDISAYKAFGLDVGPTPQRQRSYDLATTVLSVGIRKDF